MTFPEVAEAIVAWARDLIPELKDGYPHPGATAGDLPDVVVALQRIKDVQGDPVNFPMAGLEQARLRVFEVELSIMIEQQGDGSAAEGAAHRKLEEFAETLLGSTHAEATVGGVIAISPLAEVDLAEPVAERPDGTRGRTLYMRLAAATRLDIG